jgi:4-hydroxy-tetrahydrodipicolinate reductase
VNELLKNTTMKIGLIGFGKTGKAVASVLLKNPDTILEWVLRQSPKQENRLASEILEIESEDPGTVHSIAKINLSKFLDEKPVDIIIDFSEEKGIYSYGEQAAEKAIKIVSAVSHYEQAEVDYLKKLALKTTVFWSPNI